MFSFARLGTDLTPPGVWMLAWASKPQIVSVPEPLHHSADGQATAVRMLGCFRSVPGLTKEGGCLDYLFRHFDAGASPPGCLGESGTPGSPDTLSGTPGFWGDKLSRLSWTSICDVGPASSGGVFDIAQRCGVVKRYGV